MYICICQGVTDGQIRQAIDNGACTKEQLIKCFGMGRDCGKCRRDIKELLSNAGHCSYHSEAEDTALTQIETPAVYNGNTEADNSKPTTSAPHQ